jgi:hypothetical protein
MGLPVAIPEPPQASTIDIELICVKAARRAACFLLCKHAEGVTRGQQNIICNSLLACVLHLTYN